MSNPLAPAIAMTETTPAALAAVALASAPEPTATATPPPAPKSTTTPPPAGRDALGRAFDASKFRTEKDALGRWKNLRGGRRPKSGATPSPAAAAPAPAAPASYVAPDAPPAAPVPIADRYELAADLYCRSFYALADSAAAGYGEWVPDDPEEHKALAAAAAAYLRAKGTDDLPPGPALALAVGTYAAKRFYRPNTQTRIRLAWSWLRARLASWRTGRKISALPEPRPPSHEPAAPTPLSPEVSPGSALTPPP